MGSCQCVCVLGVVVMLGLWVHCSVTESMCGAHAPGDIVIGILSSVHFNIKDVQPWILPEMSTCINFDLITFVQALASIHTIEMINDSGFLPGIRLGYLMCDPCAHAVKALHCVEQMLAVNGSLSVLSDYSNFYPPVKVFLGERYTETSIPVAKLLSLYRIPQISCTSSAAALSDKLRYTSFFRVIPSNIHQTKALAKLMSHFKWKWVGVVTLDDDYGKGVFENFLIHAENEKICLAFQEVVPNYLNLNQCIKEVAHQIRSSNATVVLLILRVQQVEMLFEEMIKTNTNRTWIASNTWSMARYLMKMKDINKVGDIIGINFITGNIPGFENYLQNLRPGPGARNDFIKEYKQMRFNCSYSQQSEHTSPSACSVTDPQEANDDYLLQAVDPTEAYTQRVAVYALAHAIKTLLKCNNTACSGDRDFLPWKLIDIFRKMNFTLDNQTYSFDENGDFENGYDILMWKNHGDEKISEVVGKYLIKNGEVDIDKNKTVWSNNKVPITRCSDLCPPGTVKNILGSSCCYSCVNCTEGYYSDKWDQPVCKKCSNGSWSLPGSSQCQEWKIWFLEWSSAYSIVVLVGTVIGILLLVFSLIFFIQHRERPLIRGILGISCLMKLGLMVSFGSVIVFLGRPNIHLCRAQQTMYALGFTLCVACILVKAFYTLIAFMSSSPHRQRALRKLDKPLVIISFLTLGQALVCIFWLIFDPLDVQETPSKTQPLTLNLLCTQGSMYGFGAMHVYIALLAVICFIMAFKGRDNETDPIVFSMLIHLFAWLCFIPVFITQEELRPIVQISAIMVSSYGVIFCHFTPKWYKILSEKADTRKTAKSPGSLPTDDSGVVSRRSLESISLPSQPQARFSFVESNISDWDCSSLYSEVPSSIISNSDVRLRNGQRQLSLQSVSKTIGHLAQQQADQQQQVTQLVGDIQGLMKLVQASLEPTNSLSPVTAAHTLQGSVSASPRGAHEGRPTAAAGAGLQVGTLAAGSGWSQAALVALFCNGLSPRLQRMLACRGESLGAMSSSRSLFGSTNS
ncbi:G-protein coupled receptor family C group 6 member A-like [Salminus brasiliensis]|uniref:G-protein coupled receptor family C group 6 member A-like n=1 Tax=Salminus brasiliensis TaxID=930266 RepID=UPI003B836D92